MATPMLIQIGKNWKTTYLDVQHTIRCILLTFDFFISSCSSWSISLKWGGAAWLSDSGSLVSFAAVNAELEVDEADFFGTLLLGGPDESLLDESLLADPPGR